MLAEMGCYSSRLAKKRKAVLDLLGERRPCVLDNVVASGDGKNFSRTCRVTVFSIKGVQGSHCFVVWF